MGFEMLRPSQRGLAQSFDCWKLWDWSCPPLHPWKCTPDTSVFHPDVTVVAEVSAERLSNFTSEIGRPAILPYPTGIAEIGSLVGHAGRVSMLISLMDGRALTATELAAHAGITPQTASGHLAKLLAARLIVMERQGRHRYHRLASVEVARMLENMMYVAARANAELPGRPKRTGLHDAALVAARTCYDHLAGKLGVDVADAMAARGQIKFYGDDGAVTKAGCTFMRDFGIDLDAATRCRRMFCRPCLDWSERRLHLAGAVGAAIAKRCFDLGWVRRMNDTRALSLTPSGRTGFLSAFGINPSL